MPESLPPSVDAAIRTVADRLGIDHRGARAIRLHDAATVLLPAAGVVVRLVPSSAEAVDRTRRAVQLTAWLAGQGFPSVRPAYEEVIALDGWVASVWEEVAAESGAPPADANTALGRLLRDLHRLPAPPFPVRAVEPMRSIRAALALDTDRLRPVLDPDSAGLLRATIDSLSARYDGMSFPLGAGLIHNDAHTGNLIPDRTSDHGYVLGDWDGAGTGPREWDLTLVGAPGSRFGDPENERAAFCLGYGYDIGSWPHYQVLRDIRDLHALAAYIRTAPHHPAALAELHARVGSLRDDDRTVVWHTV